MVEVIGGVTETVKTGLRLGAGMTGAAIGQALIPIPVVGGLVGYLAGDTLMSLITGKSHSEKKAEAEEQQQALINNQQQALEGHTTTNSTTKCNAISNRYNKSICNCATNNDSTTINGSKTTTL